ncbi:response regulator transcription factor [Pseudomonas sp. HY7a-MNA-CIBAN-0227]|uniref:response regulator transcription factor n=1 Tax=Pseudomonas sp. HY7a-MNA-CIBAN-0227 TaxID=3140474 RepID=UPI003327B8EC
MQLPHSPPAHGRILAVEDDPVLAAHLGNHLGQRGFEVTLRHDGGEIVDLVRSQDFDLILMDIMLPGSSGLEVLAQLRRHQRVPVILMSALGAEQDRITGFSQGADDYLPKPFSMLEMDVRIDAILRRVAYEHEVPGGVRHDPQLLFDEQRADVSQGGQWADLTTTEYRVLETLVAHVDEVLSKAFLYQQVMHRAYSQHDRSLDMHVSRIRRKLQAIGYTAGRVETVRSMGYMLTRRAA